MKLQTLTLASKLVLLAPDHDRIGKIGQYCFQLAKCDEDYDVRDRGRMLSSLLADICPILKEQTPMDEEDEYRNGISPLLFRSQPD